MARMICCNYSFSVCFSVLLTFQAGITEPSLVITYDYTVSFILHSAMNMLTSQLVKALTSFAILDESECI